MSALSDEYSKNFSSKRKAEFNRRFSEDYDPAMSELSNILRILAEMRQESAEGGIMRIAYQDGTDLVDFYTGGKYDTDDVVSKTQDLITKGADQFNKFSGIDQITGENFPGSFDEPSGKPSDFRHQAASNLLAETLGKGKFTDPILGPISYLSGAVGATGLGAIKEIGDLFVGLNDPNLTKKEAFTEFLKDNLSNIKGAFSLPGTTSEELYSEIMKDYVPMDRFGMMRLGSNFFKKQKELKNKQALERLEKARAAKTAEAAARAQTKAMADRNRARGRGGFQSDFAQDRDFMSGKGTAAEMGSFAKGGLARMLGE